MENVGNMQGRGFIYYRTEKGKKPKKIPWAGDYYSWLIELSGYVIREYNKRDNIPVIEKRQPTREENIEADIIIEAIRETLHRKIFL